MWAGTKQKGQLFYRKTPRRRVSKKQRKKTAVGSKYSNRSVRKKNSAIGMQEVGDLISGVQWRRQPGKGQGGGVGAKQGEISLKVRPQWVWSRLQGAHRIERTPLNPPPFVNLGHRQQTPPQTPPSSALPYILLNSKSKKAKPKHFQSLRWSEYSQKGGVHSGDHQQSSALRAAFLMTVCDTYGM